MSVCPKPCLNLTDDDNDIFVTTFDDVTGCTDYNQSALIRTAIRDARQSFPSYSLTMTSFSAIFVAIYLSQSRLRRCHAWSRSLRGIFGLIAIWGVALIANSKLTQNRNHIEDVLFGIVIGAINATFVAICYLNFFNENLINSKDGAMNAESSSIGSTDEKFESTADDVIRYLQIPRVILRNSMRLSRRWSRPSQMSSSVGGARGHGRLPSVPELRTAATNNGHHHQEIQMNYIHGQRFL